MPSKNTRNDSSNDRASCPCKNVTWSLSSYTAAEFGNTQALSQALEKNQNNKSIIRRQQPEAGFNGLNTGGITPLHLAAQHGHVSATWLLLEQGHPVDGQTAITAVNNSSTPLHRASFSGAVATMRLLLDQKASPLALDMSFGDQRTPLHKAAAGGRYLAVSLLVDTLRDQGLLSEALSCRDRKQETPLQVAQTYQAIQTQERQSVARWDVVAGGQADWDKCVQLLELLEVEQQQQQQQQKDGSSNSDGDEHHLPSANNRSSSSGAIIPMKQQQQQLPIHSFSQADCLDCGDECVTASWSNAFTKALQNNFSSLEQQQQQQGQQQGQSYTSQKKPAEDMDTLPELHNNEPSTTKSFDNQIMIENSSAATPPTIITYPSPDNVNPSTAATPAGRSCEACGKITIVLFPVESSGKLVCKKCKPKRRRPLVVS